MGNAKPLAVVEGGTLDEDVVVDCGNWNDGFSWAVFAVPADVVLDC